MTTLTVSTRTEELAYNYERQNITAKLSGGVWSYFCAGRWVNQETYDILYPAAKYVAPTPKGENVCKKYSWRK